MKGAVGKSLVLVGLGLLLSGTGTVSAQTIPQRIAVFGDNATDDFINNSALTGAYGLSGFTAVVVTDAQLSVSGFLDSFDAFYYTRNGSNSAEAASLSEAAATNVRAFVGTAGNVVLLNGDFADALPGAPGSSHPITGDPQINRLTANAVRYAVALGHGYIGEYSGAVAALSSNTTGRYRALGLVSGTAGPLGLDLGESSGSIYISDDLVPQVPPAPPRPPAVAAGFAVLSEGLDVNAFSNGYNPDDVEFGCGFTGINPDFVVTFFENGDDPTSGNPAVVLRPGIAALVSVPEPGSSALFGVGLLGLSGYIRRRKTS